MCTKTPLRTRYIFIVASEDPINTLDKDLSIVYTLLMQLAISRLLQICRSLCMELCAAEKLVTELRPLDLLSRSWSEGGPYAPEVRMEKKACR